MSDPAAPNDLARHRAASLFGTYTTQAFADLSFRLLRKLAHEPGFAEEFAGMADAVVAGLGSATPSGHNPEALATVQAQAVVELRQQFDLWLEQLRAAAQP